MQISVEVLFHPAEFMAGRRDLAGSNWVVFDVLRATSVIVTGLANGARSFIPVAEIAEALAWRRQRPDVLLAGERDGLRITAAAGGGTAFDFGNSPREYLVANVAGRDIVTTTTNGTRALRACGGAEALLAGSFLNLTATARWLAEHQLARLGLACAGTGAETALEDVLCAGALIDVLLHEGLELNLSDAAKLALFAHHQAAGSLVEIVRQSKNGARLAGSPELAADIDYCLRRDTTNLVALQDREGRIIAAR